MTTKLDGIIWVAIFISVYRATHAQTLMNSFKSVQNFSTDCTVVKEFPARNRISCMTACGKSPTCYGVRWASNKTCSLLYHDCFSIKVSWSAPPTNQKVYRKRITTCQNNSSWVNSTFGCSCTGCWVGYYCERYPLNCTELVRYAYAKTYHTCILDTMGDGQALAKTTCKLFTTGSVFTMIAITNSTAVAQNRSWAEYEGGFWNNTKHFFIGLKQTLGLNNRQGLTTVRVEVDFSHQKGNWTWIRENLDFNMQDQSRGYSFTATKSASLLLDDYIPKTITTTYTLSDLMDLSQGAPFSTYDMDQDNITSKNCAALAGAGWWFRNCSYTVNPFGSAETIRIPGINMQDPEIQSSFTAIGVYFYSKA